MQPLAAYGVLYQVLHYPVGGEQLGGGGDVFAFDDFAHHLVFLFGDIELVEPADDLYVLPVVFRDRSDQFTDEGVGFGEVVWQQQFGGIVYGFKQERHGVV